MQTSIVLAIFLGVLGGRDALVKVTNPPPAKQLKCTVRVCSGDPLGDEKKGTLKIVAEPKLVTLENRTCSFSSGTELAVPDGSGGIQFVELVQKVQIKPGIVRGGTIHLDITYSSTTAEDPTPERLRLRTEGARTIGTYKLGDVIKHPLGPRQADQQEWIEVVVDEVKP